MLPAVERYDGPCYRVLRRFVRECPTEAHRLVIRILSAEFGLLPADQLIPTYNRRMTPQRAAELQPRVLAHLRQLLRRGDYEAVFISAGELYRRTLQGFERYVPACTAVSVSAGAPGRMQAELYAWLRGTCPPSRVTPSLGLKV
ncbi:MAG: DUF6884 domain-containing protein, partial [Chloroflexota bacterium]